MGNEEEEVTQPECSFKFHEFTANVGDLSIVCHTIKMDNCLYVWIGSKENAMDDLSFAIGSPYEREPLTTKIMGPVFSDFSTNLAKRLSKKLSIAVYVSFNVQVDNLSLSGIERRLRDEFNSHPEIL